MKLYFPFFLMFVFSSLLFLASCKDKEVSEDKGEKPVKVQVEVQKTSEPETVKEVVKVLPPKQEIRKITVKDGEWLYNISRREYGNIQGWKKIYDANKTSIYNPDLIFPNQELIIPE